jgi:multiple sugar transport system permease protein
VVLRPNFGLLNKIILGLSATAVNVLGDPDLVTYGIIAAGLWPQTAYCMILYLTGLNAVSPTRSRPRGSTARRAGGCSGT